LKRLLMGFLMGSTRSSREVANLRNFAN